MPELVETGNARVAIELAAAGFSVFPCQSSGEKVKQPMPGVFWRSASTSDKTKVAGWWRRWPDAAVGIDLAKSGIVVIDADRHGQDDGVAAIAELFDEHQFDPNGVPVVGTPNQGTHFYFRQPSGVQLGNGRGALPSGIDVRGAGGYVLAPGSVLSDGRRYEAFGDILDAPVMPEWLVAMIKAPERATPAPVHVPTGPAPSDERVRAYVDSALQLELEAVRSAPVGHRNEQLNRSAFSLGQLVGAGWIASGTVAAMLENAAADLVRDDGPIAVRKTIRSGLTSGAKQPRQMPESSYAVVEDGYDASRLRAGPAKVERVDPETGEIVDMASVPSGEVPPLYDGTDWLHPAGLLSDIADWVMATARRPNRPLAVASAISILAAACGRHIATPTRTGTHLYIAIVGDSAVGKDRPLKAVHTILDAAKMPISTTGKFKSDSAIELLLKIKPCVLAVTDELGQNLFARIGRKNGSSHEDGISNILRELWGTSFDTFDTSMGAANPTMRIYSPSLTIFGASTPDEFYRSLAGGSIENGFLNRFLVIKAAPRRSPANVLADPRIPPDNVTRKLRALLPINGGNMEGGMSCFTLNQHLDYQIVDWASPDVEAAYLAFEEHLLAAADEWREIMNIVGRTAEMALRLATIHAVSREGRYASLTMDDLSWGKAVALASADGVIRDARDRIFENESQRNYNRIRGIVREAGQAGLTRNEITRKLRGAIVGKAYDETLKALVESGDVIEVEMPPSTRGGRPGRKYICR
jgi:hypothetical protein